MTSVRQVGQERPVWGESKWAEENNQCEYLGTQVLSRADEKCQSLIKACGSRTPGTARRPEWPEPSEHGEKWKLSSDRQPRPHSHGVKATVWDLDFILRFTRGFVGLTEGSKRLLVWSEEIPGYSVDNETTVKRKARRQEARAVLVDAGGRTAGTEVKCRE